MWNITSTRTTVTLPTNKQPLHIWRQTCLCNLAERQKVIAIQVVSVLFVVTYPSAKQQSSAKSCLFYFPLNHHDDRTAFSGRKQNNVINFSTLPQSGQSAKDNFALKYLIIKLILTQNLAIPLTLCLSLTLCLNLCPSPRKRMKSRAPPPPPAPEPAPRRIFRNAVPDGGGSAQGSMGSMVMENMRTRVDLHITLPQGYQTSSTMDGR